MNDLPGQKIIQLGACAIKINSLGTERIGIFDRYVDPKEPLSPFITQLTGIRNSDVQGQPELPEVIEDFKAWIQETGCHICLSWGPDWKWLEEQIDYKFPYRKLDLKTAYMAFSCSRPSSKQAKGLLGAIRAEGLEFEGIQHRALTDALNTEYLYLRMMEKFKGG